MPLVLPLHTREGDTAHTLDKSLAQVQLVMRHDSPAVRGGTSSSGWACRIRGLAVLEFVPSQQRPRRHKLVHMVPGTF